MRFRRFRCRVWRGSGSGFHGGFWRLQGGGSAGTLICWPWFLLCLVGLDGSGDFGAASDWFLAGSGSVGSRMALLLGITT